MRKLCRQLHLFVVPPDDERRCVRGGTQGVFAHFSRQHQPRQGGRVRACVRAQRRAFGKIQRQGAALPQEHREGQFRAGRDGLPALKALPGVKNASVSFMAQKLLLEADDAQFQSILQQAVRAAKKIEPDFEIEL